MSTTEPLFYADGLSDAEAQTFTALRRSILRARGFTLLVAVCNEPVRCRSFSARLAESLPLGMARVEVPPNCQDILTEILAAGFVDSQRPVAVVGLESGLGELDFHHTRIASLNYRREEWHSKITCPLILWVPEYAFTLLSRGAPDFVDRRSGTFFFPRPEEFSTAPSPTSAFLGNDRVTRLTKDERHARVRLLRELLASHSDTSPVNQLALDAWNLELADQLVIQGDLDEASSLLQDVLLPSAQRQENDRLMAAILLRLSDIFQARGSIDVALDLLHLATAGLERAGDDQARAIALGRIADIHLEFDHPDEALRLLREEVVPTFERLGDARSLAVTAAKMGAIELNRDAFNEALDLFQRALATFKEIADPRELAVTQGQIASVLRARGNHDEALRLLREEVLPTFEQLGDVHAEALTQARIAHILLDLGHAHRAIEILESQAIPTLSRLQIPGDLAYCYLICGNSYGQLEQRAQARLHWTEAERLFRLSQHEVLADRVRRELARLPPDPESLDPEDRPWKAPL